MIKYFAPHIHRHFAYMGQSIWWYMIRLTGGSYHNDGLLEVYCNGEWGTVCDDTFGGTAATAAWRQLGYQSVVYFGSFTTVLV